MHSLNPLLRAFFSSKFPAQCSPASQYILLVPTTEFLLLNKDAETETLFTDLVSNEDFLGSHVIRTQAGAPAAQPGKETFNFRDTKGISKQFSTANGKTVVIKDNILYCHRGFKSLNKAQLLHDAIYYPEISNSPQWLLHYISRPLIGDPKSLLEFKQPDQVQSKQETSDSPSTSSPTRLLGFNGNSKRADILSFRDILIQYPAIAKQVQTPLDKLCQQFRIDLEKYNAESNLSIPSTPTSSAPSTYALSSASTTVNGDATPPYSSNGTLVPPFSEEEWAKRCLETLVLGAIEVFQGVDKQQLSALGSSTELSGPTVERMIERHVTEIVHDQLLFPKLVSIHEFEDLQLGHNLDQMADIDISQVGLALGGGQSERKDLTVRVARAVESFNKMETAQSPQEMIDVLLEAERKLTSTDGGSTDAEPGQAAMLNEEKRTTADVMNADMLVSLFLLVLIRCPVRQLHSRMNYMRDFVFIGDVESGETGYSLSTFEAVLVYLSQDAGALKKASRANRTIRHAIRKGNIGTLQRMLDPDGLSQLNAELDMEENSAIATVEAKAEPDPRETSFYPSRSSSTLNASSPVERATGGGLSHVFPFQSSSNGASLPERPPIRKRVSMDLRSMSSSSLKSFMSRSSTARSGISLDVDTTPNQLARVQDIEGNSILMKAIIHTQPEILRCLLEAEQLFPFPHVLEDCNHAGTTLFSAAIQHQHLETIAILADYLVEHGNADSVRAYFRKQDTQGRTATHYLFNAPNLIITFGNIIPWRIKDKNGCTPLFALCRSYDHDNYVHMITCALREATRTQGDGESLHLDDHVDARGNTLLHIVNDVKLIKRLLQTCDSNVNAANDKKFTPMMMASKFARIESIRAIFQDPRTDIQARDFRGLTAVELAKDEEVRIKIDELVLLSAMPNRDGRITTIVRSLFVDDGTIRMIVKSGAPTSSTNVRVTTCRRSLSDFENLARWLGMEEPSSWIPVPFIFRNPFQLPSKPSRLLLRDTQLKLEGFLKSLLSHPTFNNHETIWEFMLVPDIDIKLLAERTAKKAELRIEKLREEFDPLPPKQMPEVQLFSAHATEQVNTVFSASTVVLECMNRLHNVTTNIVEAHSVFAAYLTVTTADILPSRTTSAYDRYRSTLGESEASPLSQIFYTIQSVATGASAVSLALARPSELMNSIEAANDTLAKHLAAASRMQSQSAIRWPSPSSTLSAIGGLLPSTDGQPNVLVSRQQQKQREAQDRVRQAALEVDDLGRELAYTRQTIAEELASWQSTHAQTIKQAIRDFARQSYVVEKARFDRMKAALRHMRSAEN